MSLIYIAWYLPRNLVIAFLIGYRKVISPLYGDVCKYYPTCSHYGLQQFQQHGVVIGTAMTIWRIARCNPWSNGGVDEVSPGSGKFRITKLGFVAPLAFDERKGITQ